MKTLSVNDRVTLALITAPFSAAGAVVAMSCGNIPAAAILAAITLKIIVSTKQCIENSIAADPQSEARQLVIAKLKGELERFDSSKPHNRRKSDQRSKALEEVRQALFQRA